MTRRAPVAFAALVVGLLVATPAAAHVTVNPSEAAKGSFAKLTFRVPTERDDASTTKVEIAFPASPKISSVSVKPKPGWTYTVDEAGDAVAKVTWSGGTIKPGEFDEFDVSMGPLPDDADQIEFKALQTYDDGEVVRWIESTPEGGEEPEHPAPVLTLTAATGDEHGGSGSGDEAAAVADDEHEDHTDHTLAIVAIALAAVALGLALQARFRRSSS
jgi:uncharacterized protein